MEFKREENEEEGHYFLEEDGKVAGEIEYRLRPGPLIIEHTTVHEGFEGKGYGIKLVEKAIEDARARKYAIVPICKLARKYFDKHPEAGDVL